MGPELEYFRNNFFAARERIYNEIVGGDHTLCTQRFSWNSVFFCSETWPRTITQTYLCVDHAKVGSVTKKKKSSIFVRVNLCLKQFISEYLQLVVYAKVIAIYILVIKLCTLT